MKKKTSKPNVVIKIYSYTSYIRLSEFIVDRFNLNERIRFILTGGSIDGLGRAVLMAEKALDVEFCLKFVECISENGDGKHFVHYDLMKVGE